MAKKQDDRVASIIAAINKQFKGAAVRLGSGASSDVREVIPFGIDAVDKYVLGVGGLAVGRISELFSEEGAGKAQPLDALVLTPTGYRQMGDLAVGDLVVDPTSGLPQRVEGVYDRGELEVFEVELTDGTRTRCCREHLWEVQTSNDRYRGTHRVMELGEIMEAGLREHHGKWDAHKFQLPLTSPVEYEHSGDPLPVDPLLLGLLLGDGGFTGSSPTFTKPEVDVVDMLAQRLPSEDRLTQQGLSWRINGGATKRALRKLGLWGRKSQDKFVPDAYLRASVAARTELLAGLIITDAHAVPSGWDFSSASPELARAVVELTRSLGGVATTSVRQSPTYVYRGEQRTGLPSHRVRVVLPALRDHLSVKMRRVSPRATRPTRAIADVRPVGKQHCRCIRVENPRGLYVTNDFIVTHNTSLLLNAMAQCQKMGGIVIFCETEHAIDSKRAETFGVDLDQVVLLQPEHIPQAGQQIQAALEAVPKGAGPVLVGWDSVAATMSREEAENGLSDKESFDKRAKDFSQIMRVLGPLVAKSRAHLCLINQVRANIGVMFGDKFTTPCGKAIKFHASVRLQILGGKAQKDTAGQHTGKDVTVMAVKNKLTRPFRKCRARLDYDKGWDNDWATLNHAKELKLVDPRARDLAAARVALDAAGWYRTGMAEASPAEVSEYDDGTDDDGL